MFPSSWTVFQFNGRYLFPLISVKIWITFADFSGIAACSAELDGIFVLLMHPRPLLYLQDALQAGRGAEGLWRGGGTLAQLWCPPTPHQEVSNVNSSLG